MNLKTVLYGDYENELPQKGNWIVGQEEGDSIFVYQAFNNQIANYAIANQKFGGQAYSFSRMTWIKPNFLWMMYRAGWAMKPNQERILALKITKEGFEDLLKEGVYSSFQEDKYANHEEWKNALSQSEVRIQWDPDHDPYGDKLTRKAVQIGIKGSALQKLNEEYLQEIIDVTDFVKEQGAKLEHSTKNLMVMKEVTIEVCEELKQKFSIPNS